MGFQKNKSKRKDANKGRKNENSQAKCDKKSHTKTSTIAESENNLSTLFKSDELHELRKILKIKDLSALPILLGAVILEKFDLVKKHIKQGYSVNHVFENSTPLMWAVKAKNLEMIDLLLSRNADVSTIDNNGDNILFMAINCTIWDENTFMDFWNKMNKILDININYVNKNNFTLLHFAVKRQWKSLVEILIDKKVNVDVANSKGVTPLLMAAARNDANLVNILMRAGANVLHEDQRGCTPICFVIGNIIQKKWVPPYNTLEELTKQFKSTGELSYENYLQRRLHLIINPPNNNIVAHQNVINKITVSTIRFIMKYLQSGVELLLKLKIFAKLKQAIEKYMNYMEYLQAILSIVAMTLRWCKCCIGTLDSSVGENDLVDGFITSGTVDACLTCLIIHKESLSFKQLLPHAFLPIFIACGGESYISRQWLDTHLQQLEPFYQIFLDNCSVNYNFKEDETHVFLVKEKLKNFTTVYEELKLKTKDNSTVQKSKSRTVTSASSLLKQTEIPNQGKKQAKRVRRKNRARIAKMRSADVAERRKINTSVLLQNMEQGIETNQNAIIENEHISDKENDKNIVDDEISFVDVVNDVHNAESDSNNIEQYSENNEANELIEIIVNNAVKIVSSENVLQEEVNNVHDKREEMNNINSSQNLSIQNSSSSYQSADSGVQEDVANFEILEDNANLYIDNNMVANRRAGFYALITRLRLMLNEIITEYESYWNRDRILHHPGYVDDNGDTIESHPLLQGSREEQIHYLNGLLPYIEQQKIYSLIDSFNKVILKIEELFNNDDPAYKHLFIRLKSLLTNHCIRGKKYFVCISNDKDEVVSSENIENNFGAIGEHLPRPIGPTYMELIENVLPNKQYFKYNNDEIYLKEMLSIPQINSNLSTNEVEDIKKKTEDHAYHLVNSASKICESDTSIIMKQQAGDFERYSHVNKEITENQFDLEENQVFSYVSKKQSEDTILDMTTENKIAANMITQDQLEVARISRWATTIKSLQNFLRRKLQNKGSTEEQVLTCPLEIRSRYILATGGSFGDVELAFDRHGDALALKRIQFKHITVCRMILVYVSPLLTVQHKNILRYVSCERDKEGNIYLSTPLCEYNLGEYLMYLKVDEGRQQPHCTKVEISCLITQMLNGLRYLHEQEKPIVHGNLKPSNILIDIYGQLRLAEFGIFRTLYQNAKAPKSSVIWFARETYENYEQFLSMDCTKSSDIQVAGMLTHFILTRGLHPFGIIADDILHNIIQGTPTLQTIECEVSDLISWMLLYEASERPTIRQVLMHIYFWDEYKKWDFLLACTGIRHDGVTILDFPIERFYVELDIYAKSNQIEGEWMSVIRKHFPDVVLPLPDVECCGKDTPTSLLKFMRKCVEMKLFLDEDKDLKQFFLKAFPALPLLLFVHVESTEWLLNPVFMRFLDVCK